jgi:oxygen-independent coproporphyrinogen-3 oxidase
MEVVSGGEAQGVKCGDRIETIYLGGGTPSQLTGAQLHQLFIYINKVYGLEHAKEVTMECNPDDITVPFAETLSQLPVNRVSMGVQTFSNERLRFLHRRHTAEQVPLAMERLRQAGIQNISIDLMYGFPNETLQEWKEDIDRALHLNAEHLSAYALMYEEGTPLYQRLEDGTVSEIDEELSLQMYSSLIDRLTSSGYEHYEISNFAKPGFRSRHNSSYWNQTPYIGLGAAAHSYNGKDCRRWNVDDINQYIEGIEKGSPAFEQEVLDEDTRYNDIVMTALRTCEGLNMAQLSDGQAAYCLQQAQRFIADNRLQYTGSHLRLTRQGMFVSNMIMSELMKV